MDDTENVNKYRAKSIAVSYFAGYFKSNYYY